MKVKISNSNQVKETQAVLKALDGLYKQGVKWTQQYDRTNANLYLLLSKCLEIYEDIKGKNIEGEVVKAMSEALVNRGFNVKKNSKVILLIVRYVFNTERRRVYSYARALQIAIADGVKVAQFSKWVTDQGGIDEVATKKGKTEEAIHREATLKLKVDEARDLLVGKISKPLAVVAKDQFTDRAGGGEYTLLIGKTNGDNQTQVLCTVPNATAHMVDAAILKIAMALMQDEKTNAAKEVLATRDASVQALVKTVKAKDMAKVLPHKSGQAKTKAASSTKKKSIAAKRRSKAA